MRVRTSLLLLASIISAALAAPACSDDGGTGASGGEASSTTTTASGAGGSGGDGGGTTSFMDHGDVVSVTVDPPMTTIDVTNGASSPESFVAIATYEDQTTAPVQASWSFDQLPLALVDEDGVVTANGNLGGEGTLTATVGSLTATASVTVKLHFTDNPAGLSPADQMLFDAPDGNPSGTLLYPYDQTVFARGIRAPLLQWDGGAPGDSYQITLTEPFAEATLYVDAEPPSRAAIPENIWTALTESNKGGSLSLSIKRLSGGQAHQAMTQSWTIAQGSLRGSIYYWAVNTGQLMKIAPGAASPSIVFDSGPADQLGTPTPANYNGAVPPWESGGNNKRCVACHTVSKDGSRIASVFEKAGSTASPWGTIDLAADPPGVLQITPYDSTTIYLALTPDGALAVENDVNMSMRLRDATSGAPIASALDGIVDKVADPAFSPDGKLLAFSSNVTGSYPVEFWRADLDVFDFDQASNVFSNRRTIANGGAEAIAFPSFSPDSGWVVYQKGNYSRAKYGANQVGSDDLFITDVAGAAGESLLAAASGADLEPKNQHIAYQPTVNPIAVGGYIWVVFVSPRDYGNSMRSTSNPTYENRKQLWVAAVDVNPVPGQDPSHPAFWLPGQDASTINMSGYWALEACHQEGDSCEQGFECCGGFCQPDDMGNYVCVPPPGGCAREGEACETASDCCDSATHDCIGGFCALAEPQ
ncbi:MAG: hypothetical protein HOW73_00500 [Polyangiaceae bacterium]|nr:hypothetical protein [Polyangiaceae bacterium]